LKITHSFFPGLLASKKWRKTSTEGGCPKWLHKIAKALPYKGPAVGVQLGRGHVDFRQECLLKTRERQTEFYLLEDSGVEEEEGFPVVGAIISGHRFTLRAWPNGYIYITFFRKDAAHTGSLVLPVLYHVSTGSERGSLGKEFVRSPWV